MVGRAAEAGDACFESLCIPATDVEAGAKGRYLLDAGLSVEFGREGGEIGAGDFPCGKAGGGEDIMNGAAGQQMSVCDIGQAVAAFGFIHVMGGDKDGEAIGGKAVDFIPEVAAGLWVHPGGGFVEEEKAGFVDEAGGEGEALFPSPGELAGELGAAAFETERADRVPHGFGGIPDLVNIRDESQVFGDREVFIETEALSHVADFPFDGVALFQDVVSEAGAAAGVGFQQAAEDAQESGFSTAVGSEKSVDFALSHLHGEVVHHDLASEGFRDVPDINGECTHRGASVETRST